VTAWTETPGVCGSCIAWRPDVEAELPSQALGAAKAAPDAPEASTSEGPDDAVPVGRCRLRSEMGRVPASLPRCPLYRQRGTTAPAPRAPRSRTRTRKAGPGRPSAPQPEPSAPTPPPIRPPQRPSSPRGPVGPEARAWSSEGLALLQQELGPSRDLLGRFEGGQAEIRDREGHAERFPVEVFFRRLVRLRNALDQLESAVDSKPALADEADVLVGLVRKMHGSLTSFNLLFEEKIDQFSGKN